MDSTPARVAERELLARFGTDPTRFLGRGGEAQVFALGDDRVLRLLHPRADIADVHRRRSLLDSLDAGAVDFAIPSIERVEVIDGRVAVVERRLAGESLLDVLGRRMSAERRHALVRASLDAAASIARLAPPFELFGTVASAEPIQTGTWHDAASQLAARSLARAGPDFGSIDAAHLAHALPTAERPVLVHVDAFAGNMLTDGTAITAVIDFGAMCLAGSDVVDPIAVAVYLAPEITPTATDADRGAACSWLGEKGLLASARPVERWLAACWAFAADDDEALGRWCRRVLVDGKPTLPS